MNIILIAHNQIRLVQQNIEMLVKLENISFSDIIIVDNASQDGLQAWLEEQNGLNYLICNEGIESYSVILNTICQEFELHEEILILTPEHMILPGMLNKMKSVLTADISIGAVTAKMIYCGTEVGKDYFSAMKYAQEYQKKSELEKKKLAIKEDVILIKLEMIKEVGKFDENLILPFSVMVDFLLRGIKKGFSYYECGKAFFYKMQISNLYYYEHYTKDVDRKYLKKKWGMNYFNIFAHSELIEYVQKPIEEDFQILEIGCDCGVNLLEIKNKYPMADCYGMEINESAAEIAESVANVVVGNIEMEDIPFEGILFDYIIFGDVLEHLHNPEKVLRDCRKRLKANGKIIASIPNRMHYSVMRDLINGNFSYTDTGLLDKTHIHFFTYNEIIKMFEKENFVIENIGMANRPIAPEDKSFVDKLTILSESAEAFMFEAYQYYVVAKLM